MLQMMRNPAFMQQMMQNLPPSLRQSIGDDPEALSRMVGERERDRERKGRGREREGERERERERERGGPGRACVT